MRRYGAACLGFLMSLSVRAEAQDMRDTYIHYLLTYSEQVQREIDDARTAFDLTFRLTQERAGGEVRKADDFGIFTTRWEGLPAWNPRTQHAHLLGTIGFQTAARRVVRVYGGLSFYSLSLATKPFAASYGNVLGGADVRLSPWFSVDSSLSFNLFPSGSSDWLLDRAKIIIRSPALGFFGLSEYDLARGKPRDFQTGFRWVFSERALGEVLVALDHRVEYPVTGWATRNDGHLRFTVEADTTGVLRWENVLLTKSVGFSVGVAAGDIEGVLRYGFVELRALYDVDGALGLGYVFVRGGAARDRLNRRGPLVGLSGGFAMSIRDPLVIRLSVGQNDPETVDRMGGTDGVMGSFTLGIGL